MVVQSPSNAAGPTFDSKTEEWVYCYLRDVVRVYLIAAHPARFILAPKCTYEPDILVVRQAGDVPVFLEVKPADKNGRILWRKGATTSSGKSYTSDGKIKYRIAKATFPIWDWGAVGVGRGRVMDVEGDIDVGFFRPKEIKK